MKSLALLAIAASFFATQPASAEIFRKACSFKDYKALKKALQKQEVTQGVEHKEDVLDLLSQEWGATCNALIETEVLMGIPGREHDTYEIYSSERHFEVTLVSDMESNRNYVIIEKK